MRMLVTDPSLGVWETGEAGSKKLPDLSKWPCAPCSSSELVAFCCAESRECICLEKATYRESCRMPCVPGVACMCLSPCSRFVFQLSSEADCIHTRACATGELLYAAPAGVFPRSMTLDNHGKKLLAAGGAVDEAYLFSVPDLLCERVIHTRHPCFAADFWRDGLVLVCASEGEDIHSVFYTLSPDAVRPRKLIALPGAPGTLSVCQDGVHAVVSTYEGLMKINLHTGELLWNRPEWSMCMRICCHQEFALISSTLDGRVCLLNHHRPWESRILMQGRETEGCFL